MQVSTSRNYWLNCKEDFADKSQEELDKFLLDICKTIITEAVEDPVIDMAGIILISPQRKKEDHYLDLLNAFAKAVITYSKFKDLFIGYEPLNQIITTFEAYREDKSHPKDMWKQATKILLLFNAIEREFDDDVYDMDKHEFID